MSGGELGWGRRKEHPVQKTRRTREKIRHPNQWEISIDLWGQAQLRGHCGLTTKKNKVCFRRFRKLLCVGNEASRKFPLRWARPRESETGGQIMKPEETLREPTRPPDGHVDKWHMLDSISVFHRFIWSVPDSYRHSYESLSVIF